MAVAASPRIASLFSGRSLRFRLTLSSLVWVTGLILIAAAAIYGLLDIRKADDALARASAVAVAALGVEADTADLIVIEQTFVAAPTAARAAEMRTAADAAVLRADALAGAVGDLGLPTDDVAALADALRTIVTFFGELDSRQAAIGYDADSGLHGDFLAAEGALGRHINKISKSGMNEATVRIVQGFAQLSFARSEFQRVVDATTHGSVEAAIGRLGRYVGKAAIGDADKAEIQRLSDSYAATFSAWSDALVARTPVVDKLRLNFDLVPAMVDTIVAAADERRAAAAAHADAVAQRTMMVLPAVALVTLLVGVSLNTAIARGITGPLGRLKAVMTALAEGGAPEVPDTHRADEAGDMARAVAVFRDNALERRRLADDARQETETRLARQTRVDDLIAGFRAEVRDTLHMVAVSMEEMEGTAGAMIAIAEETAERTGTAATASASTRSGVQTVASAAEELSASITEIETQVAQTNDVVTRAAERPGLRRQGPPPHRRRPPDRRRGGADPGDRRPDQPARPQRDHRAARAARPGAALPWSPPR
ncbi:HAMP domain protein [Methylobrevis pamukkalensis]|uniref:HAMP domain protein n=1 Tax=Methylobrevis pamukkalensis TaxID=1439726 RepID=A0A1E3H8A2_9HYPH|nr:methyl-accepting chemotaxis protein [Methylobrevis pamukkalensis]ODN72543.1 HAMP domain protein [Methylobrevis pamukkalensis]